MSKKKIYIAGKVTGLPINQVLRKFAEAQSEIEDLGFKAINPIAVVNDSSCDWNVAMKLCIKELIDCDGLVILPCWILSEGAKIERQLAEDLNIPIFNFHKVGLEYMVKNMR
jgi:hypothetical protein